MTHNARDCEAKASIWLMRLEEPGWTDEDQEALLAWLNESDAHRAAFWRLQRGWKAADRLMAAASPPIPGKLKSGFARGSWFALAASLAALVVAGPAAFRVQPAQPAPARFQTGIGGHRGIALSDGSMVELDAATIARAAVSSTSRDVWLDRGQAFFVIKHMSVPFVVHAGPRLVTVLGTQFSVMRDGDKVRVAVVEGTVRVSDANQSEPAPTATIAHGDLLQSDGSSTLLLQHAEARIDQSLAWRDGFLLFDDTPLTDVATQFNRYNSRKLVVAGNAGSLRIGGSFRASNVEAFARLLHDAYGLNVEQSPTELTVSN